MNWFQITWFRLRYKDYEAQVDKPQFHAHTEWDGHPPKKLVWIGLTRPDYLHKLKIFSMIKIYRFKGLRAQKRRERMEHFWAKQPLRIKQLTWEQMTHRYPTAQKSDNKFYPAPPKYKPLEIVKFQGKFSETRPLKLGETDSKIKWIKSYK